MILAAECREISCSFYFYFFFIFRIFIIFEIFNGQNLDVRYEMKKKWKNNLVDSKKPFIFAP